ncbi:glycosyltransferase family 39 protein [Uliginosibacterium sp. H1]|uniref:glycosyltransferase family 39 protein n=1 Tax=Uliginosibacterium sp. H1 TaxID=3114757 RepID=UPI002E185CEB|nr:glycosyltransferase family 39 protein [Uliginosibacterium sp. H1]
MHDATSGRALRQLTVWLLLLTAYRIWVIPHLGVSLYVDEAQYWTWAKELDWGYYSKPPVVAWLIAASTALFGDGLIAVKLPSLLLYPATSFVLFALVRHLYDAALALKVAVAFSLIPLVSALGLFVSTDAPLLFCWAAAMLALVRALEDNRWTHWLLLGALVGIGLMAKYTMAAFGLSAALYVLIDARRRHHLLNPKLWVAMLLAAAILAPNLWWNWQNDFPTLRHTADITHVAGNDKSGNLGEFLLAQVGSLGPVFALAFIASLLLAWRTRGEARMQLLLCFALPLLLITTAQSERAEANGNWAAPALVGALILATLWLSQRSAGWWRSAIAVNAVLMLAVYHLQDVWHLTGRELPPRWDPLNRGRGFPELAQQVRPLLIQHPDAYLLVDDRAYAAHMLYELRDLKPQLASWNRDPQGRIASHYQLTRPLDERYAGRTAILVSKWEPSEILAAFDEAATPQHWQLAIAEGRSREAWLTVVKGYRGRP